MEKHSHELDGHLTHRDGGYDNVGSTETNVADGFTMVAVGDLILSRPLTKGNTVGLQGIVEILSKADATFGNMETLIFDIRSFKGSPQAEYGGAYHISVPDLGRDLKSMGFNLMSRANNHSLDWGVEGMRETSRLLDENGITHAGVGETLSQAGAARFLETAKGRVALVSFATTFMPMSRACDPAGEAPGRPGVNALRLMRNITLPPDALERLRRVRNVLPGYASPERDPGRVVLLGEAFVAGDKPSFSYQADPSDEARVLRNVRRGKQFSDFCIVTNHGHEPDWSELVSEEPADFEQPFARKMIDAGADAYIAHGPHLLRGIEIYKGRPIFYGVGNFFFDDLRTPVGADMFDVYGKDPRLDTDAEVTVDEQAKGYPSIDGFVGALGKPIHYESVIAVSLFQENQLSEVLLYPIELGFQKRFANRGTPSLASGPQAKSILLRLQALSQPFGTRIAIESGVGVIRLKRGSVMG
ncbi:MULTISPECIES: CapA family protein [Rhizobium]|uniref:CapA family protein n=1 Tax=Rhizobium TaxID=379 RepID=UPI001A99D86C|nr:MULTISPECIES: CapA family protein [Rhizobium]MBX4893923.1 CapA family protein [Rhizobium bangladeshense]MBX4935260.1 CapA family protein [Rhizobium bangladeshense]MBX5242895.1 CapA family protein [Rhizobium sp. NLR22b]QSY91948.1 CapA family protein [Rhizobium bangladeshense]